MNKDLLEKISQIVEGEKLAMDTYFFCGAGSSVPDADLISSGEAYLNAARAGQPDEAAKAKLIERLEAACSTVQPTLRVKMTDVEDPRITVIKAILEHKDEL